MAGRGAWGRGGGAVLSCGVIAVLADFDAAHLPMDFAPGPTWIVLAHAGTRTRPSGG